MNLDSRSSSPPPGSDSAYRQPHRGEERDRPADPAPDEPPTVAVGEAVEMAEASDDGAPAAKEPSGAARPAARGTAWQPGAPGFDRPWTLTANVVLDRWPERCAAGDEPFLAELERQPYGGTAEIEVLPADPNTPSLRLWVTQHRFRKAACGCGHCSRRQPPRAVVLLESEGARVHARQMPGRAWPG